MKKIILTFCLLATHAAFKCCAEAPKTAQSQIAALKAKLNQIILPDVVIAEASFDESIEYLRLKSRELDTQTDPTSRGINFVIIGKATEKKGNSLGLSLRNVPLSEVILGTAEQFDMKFVEEPHAVVFYPNKYQMLNPVPMQKATLELELRLQKIIRPTVQFQNATVEEALEYLRISSGCLDLEGNVQRSVNVLLKTNQTKPSPLISLDLKNVSQGDALRYVAEIAGLKLRYQAEAAVLSPKDDDLGKIELRGKAAAKAHADQIILPIAQFENATLAEVVEYVRIKSALVDPAKKGINILIAPEVSQKPACSLEVRQMTVSELLRYVAGLLDLKISADDRTFVFSAK